MASTSRRGRGILPSSSNPWQGRLVGQQQTRVSECCCLAKISIVFHDEAGEALSRRTPQYEFYHVVDLHNPRVRRCRETSVQASA